MNCARRPPAYYAEDSGVGLALRFCCDGRPRNIGVIGLGAGTIAAYGRSGDHIQFYEINPAVEPIARNVFTYIRDSRRTGRRSSTATRGLRSLAKAPQGFDVLVNRRLLRRCDSSPSAHQRGHRALPKPSGSRRNPGLPHLQPARGPGAADRIAGQGCRDDRPCTLQTSQNDERGEFARPGCW